MTPPGYKYFKCCKVGRFTIVLYGKSLTFGASLKWPLEELQFLAHLHFSAPKVAAYC